MQNNQTSPTEFKVVSPLHWFKRNLTPVAIAVLLLGLTAFALGPLRLMLGRSFSGQTSASGGTGQIQLTADNDSSLIVPEALIQRELEPFTIIPDRARDEVFNYTVQPGDTLTVIANRFGIDKNTVFWSNAETLGDNVHFLEAGIDLNILPVDGVYHRSDGVRSLESIAAEYQASVDDILNSPHNELADYTAADIPPWGMKIVVPGGQREIVDWRMPVIETIDQATGTVVRGFMPGMSGSCSSGIGGGGGTGAWAVPMGAYSLTQGYYPGHSGLDLANVTGTPVLAADTGVVVFNGWVPADWGYGILVVLDHGNGWTTYYAHLNGTAVSCGQTVPRGSTLGWVGSTGKSTGAHLHFEMRWNHTPDNPAAYIPVQY